MTSFHVTCITLCQITWHHFISYTLFCVKIRWHYFMSHVLFCVALFCVRLHVIAYHMHYFVLNYMTSFHIICIILCQITWYYFMSHITWHYIMSHTLFCVRLHDIISCHMHYFVLNYMTLFHATWIILH